jgi:hypothetical protein
MLQKKQNPFQMVIQFQILTFDTPCKLYTLKLIQIDPTFDVE